MGVHEILDRKKIQKLFDKGLLKEATVVYDWGHWTVRFRSKKGNDVYIKQEGILDTERDYIGTYKSVIEPTKIAYEIGFRKMKTLVHIDPEPWV